jgi:hypothetical protein
VCGFDVGKQNLAGKENHMDPKVEQQFRKELKERDDRVREATLASALGVPAGAKAAEAMAAKAKKIQDANPGMSNIQAVKAAYEAEGTQLD